MVISHWLSLNRHSMEDGIVRFKNFNDEEEANDFIQRLREKNIPLQLEDTDKFFDPILLKNRCSRN